MVRPSDDGVCKARVRTHPGRTSIARGVDAIPSNPTKNSLGSVGLTGTAPVRALWLVPGKPLRDGKNVLPPSML
jgi:hypothetical protein